VSRIDRHADVARAYAQEADIGVPGATPLLLAVDMRAYQRLVGGTPAGFDVPPALSKPPPIPSVVPAFVSPDWTGGGTFQITLPSQGVNFIALAHKNTFAGVPRGTPFAVVSLDALRQAVGVLEPNRLYVRHADARAVAEAVADAAPGATITSRAAVVRSIRSSPLVDSVLRGFRWAIVVAAIYAAVAIALLAVIAARSRARDLALIRTMGGSQRDTLVLAAVELAPFVLVSLVLGIGLGIAVPYLIEPGLDLGFFTRSRTNAIVVSWAAPVAFAVGAVVLVAAAVVIVGARTRRTDLARALRIGER